MVLCVCLFFFFLLWFHHAHISRSCERSMEDNMLTLKKIFSMKLGNCSMGYACTFITQTNVITTIFHKFPFRFAGGQYLFTVSQKFIVSLYKWFSRFDLLFYTYIHRYCFNSLLCTFGLLFLAKFLYILFVGHVDLFFNICHNSKIYMMSE